MKTNVRHSAGQKKQWSDPSLKKIALEPASFSLKTAGPSSSFDEPGQEVQRLGLIKVF